MGSRALAPPFWRSVEASRFGLSGRLRPLETGLAPRWPRRLVQPDAMQNVERGAGELRGLDGTPVRPKEKRLPPGRLPDRAEYDRRLEMTGRNDPGTEIFPQKRGVGGSTVIGAEHGWGGAGLEAESVAAGGLSHVSTSPGARGREPMTAQTVSTRTSSPHRAGVRRIG